MDQGFKHFSQLHNLIMHQMPEGIEVSCSGCHSSATGTVYVCWQCNFFLHDQCYRATRSLKHPSHPPHPLTLVPYPTYHSNSFYCNSCQIIGTGFSYSCADCEFDLHVQCAYSISRATSFEGARLFQELVPQGWNSGVHNSSMDHHVPFASIHESHPVSFTGAQNHYIPSNFVLGHDPSVSDHTNYPLNTVPSSQGLSMTQGQPSVCIPMSSQNQISSVQYPSVAQTGPSVSIPNKYPQNPITSAQDPSMAQNRPAASIPTDHPQNPIPSAQDPSMSHSRPVSVQESSYNSSAQYASVVQAGPSVSIPTDYPQKLIPSVQDPSMAQNRPPVSIPTDCPQNPIPSAQDLSTYQSKPVSFQESSYNSNAQYASMVQTGPSVSIPTDYPQNPTPSAQDPSTSQNKPASIPTSSYNSSTQYPLMAQNGPSVSIPTDHPQNLIPSAQDLSTSQNRPSVSIPAGSHNSSTQYPLMAQTGPSVSTPTNPSNTIIGSHDHSKPQNGSQDKEVMHFSHPHKLSRVSLQKDEENEVMCSVCEETLVGNGYSCAEPDCNFHLHKSCFHLEKEIHHKSHPEHPLTLLPLAPYENKDGEFTCNACFSDGTGFTYHCSVCAFDLHITCVSLPEIVNRDDHKHALKLFYSCPVKDEDNTFNCDVCHGEVQKDRWVYYCEQCDYGTHLGCVDCEECESDSILDPKAQLQRLQFQMEMARQNAQFIASLGSSLASLAG